MTGDRVRAALVDALGPACRSLDELGAALAPSGITAEAVERAILDDPCFAEVGAGVIHVPSAVDGMTLTTFVDDEDAATDRLPIAPWLSPLAWWLLSGEVEVEIDGEVTAVECDPGDRTGEDDAVVGPAGWLAPLAESWVTVTVAGSRLALAAVAAPPEPSEAQAAAIRAGFERAADVVVSHPPDRPDQATLRFATLDEPFEEALSADRATLLAGPIAPLPQLYGAAGLEIEGALVGEAGFDWEALRYWQDRHRVMRAHDLDEEQADRVILVSGAALTTIDDDEGTALAATEEEEVGAAALLTGILSGAEVAEAFWSEMVERGAADRLGPFAARLASILDGVDVVEPAWLGARVAERADDAERAIDLLGRAVTPLCEHRPALLDLAGYEADRSELGSACELIRRARVLDRRAVLPEHHEALVDEVEDHRRAADGMRPGRNEPCPCGSGRKYKACHLGRGLVDFEHRTAWLYDKLLRYAVQHGDDLRWHLARHLAGGSWLEAARWHRSPVTTDLALWEGKLVDGFALSRRALLPADEAELIDPWRAARRSVFEVIDSDGGRLRLHDTIVGGDVDIENIAVGPQPGRSEIVLARPTPVGDRFRSFSPTIRLERASARPVADAIAGGSLDALAATLGERLGGLGRH